MIGDLIGEWIKEILIDGIMGNLSGLFNTVNTKVGEIASDVGSTPQDWNGGIFSMLQNLSETVIVPIAAAILALVMCYELIDMIVEKNNMHDFDSSMFFRWIFKSAFLDYVKECRPLLNQDQYHLPEPPQLADFDQSLQDYKKQIEAELEQEAAASGLTVEEYVASDYEAPAQPNFSIYQVPPGPEGRDLRYRSYEDLQADGLSVDRKNYQLVYTAPLDKDTTLDEIYRRFNMEHPADYKGHSLSMGDIVVFRQDGKQTAYYVDEGADHRHSSE